MSLLASNDREQLRGAWREAWRRNLQGLPLEALQAQMVDVIAAHPEYHAQLVATEDSADSPFLHFALHLALREQTGTDRPAGIRAVLQRLARSSSTPHDAEHRMIEVLGRTLWEAQRAGRAPDEQAYLEALRRL
jgi:hypothetical protein